MDVLEGALLREVARVQHDKTLQAVRDAVESIAVSESSPRPYSSGDRTARQFKGDILRHIQRLREAEQ